MILDGTGHFHNMHAVWNVVYLNMASSSSIRFIYNFFVRFPVVCGNMTEAGYVELRKSCKIPISYDLLVNENDRPL